MASLMDFGNKMVGDFCSALNSNENFKKQGAKWEVGSVGIVIEGDPSLGEDFASDIGILLDLWHGECRGGKVGTGSEIENEAALVLKTTVKDGLEVFGGGGDPMQAFMRGKVKIAKGNLAALMPYMNAAMEMLNAAKSIDFGSLLATLPENVKTLLPETMRGA